MDKNWRKGVYGWATINTVLNYIDLPRGTYRKKFLGVFFDSHCI